MSTPVPTVAFAVEPAGSGAAVSIARAWLKAVATDEYQLTTTRAEATHVLELDTGVLRPVTIGAATSPAGLAYRAATDAYTIYGV